MKKLFALLVLLGAPLFLFAQDLTIGKTRDQIGKIIKATPTFQLGAGENTDTLKFQAGMQTIFYYKDGICYRSQSRFPLIFKDMITKHMADDGYVNVGGNVWNDAKKRVRIVLTLDTVSHFGYSEATRLDDAGKE
ncbi:MAG: hypothetical protein JSU01_09025 [Bacteroidetes bacterium]|nr:hypothetical protein [Bacteroidota bacterium]